MKRVELNVHSCYSLLKSSIKLEELFQYLKEQDITTVGISDYNTTSALIKCERLAQKYGLKVLYGCECFIADHNSFITLYACDYVGYHVLNEIVTQASCNKGVTLAFLNTLGAEKLGHLCAIIGSNHVLFDYIFQKDFSLADTMIETYQKLWPHLYWGIGITTKNERVYQDRLLEFAEQHHLMPVAFNSVHYLKREHYEDYLFLRSSECGQYPASLSERERYSYLLSEDELRQGYARHLELLDNAQVIAEQCQVTLCSGTYHFPKIKERMEDSSRYLTDLCKLGLNKRLENKKLDHLTVERYRDRLLYELDVIIRMGFADYFLIVQDIVCHAKKQGYRVGLGRGSAPSSLVVYSLGISDVDPLEYNLLFERFLNVERISMPDIDVDIQDTHRNDIVEYLVDKYGSDHICEIKAFQNFGVKSIIKEVEKLRQVDKATINAIEKYAISSQENIDLFLKNINVIKLGKAYPAIQYIINRVAHLYDIPQNISTHAVGVVMTDEPLMTYTALEKDSRAFFQSQYDKDDIGQLGLVKMDILPISNLTVIQDVLNNIKCDYPSFDLNQIPLNDRATYQLFAMGDTNNIFEFESASVKRLLQRLKVTNFMDIVEANSLNRPGPKEMTDTFIKRKNHAEPITYIHPSLMPILKETYGVIIFQEQVMLIAREFAGFTLGEADVLRDAMSHKKEYIINREKPHFIEGALAHGHTEAEAEEVYHYFYAFASYGFNKSHAISYSLIAYQMAYLKTHFSPYFAAYMLSQNVKDESLTQYYYQFLRRKGIPLKGPDINISTLVYTINQNCIYYALLSIKELNKLTVEKIVEERTRGPFMSYEDFLKRTRLFLTKDQVISLIDGGALDCFHESHKGMIEVYKTLLDRIQFGILYEENELVQLAISQEEYSFSELSEREKRALGVNIKYNAFVLLADKRQQYHTLTINNLKETAQVCILFELHDLKEITTQKGEAMAFFKASDDTGEIETVVFPKPYSNLKEPLTNHRIFVGQGSVEKRDANLQFVLREIYFLT